MFPPLLLLHPAAAAPIIQNRLRQLDPALVNAQTAATTPAFDKYVGAKYPYETVTGSELWRASDSRDEADFSRALYTR